MEHYMTNYTPPEYFADHAQGDDRTVEIPLHHDPRSSPTSDRAFVGVSKFLDGSLIALCLVTSVLAHMQTWPDQYTVTLLLAIIAFFPCAGSLSLYRPWRGETISRQFFRILLAWAATLFVLLVAAYLTKTTSEFSRLALTTWIVATPIALSGWRVIARHRIARLLSREEHQRNVIVWGGGYLANQLAATIQRAPTLGLRLVEHISPARGNGENRSMQEQTAEPEPSSRLKIDDLHQRAQRGDFSILYIVLNTTARADVFALLDRLADTSVSVYMVPDLLTRSLLQGHWSSLAGIPLVSVFDTPFWGADGRLKRLQDLVLSTLILALIAIPTLVIALLIKMTSPGPVLFKQHRYGLSGHPIRVLKFRTMTVCEDGAHVPQATRNDCRITPVGKFLRRTSLDELPQFINVLRGDMSIVGPRPHAVAHNEFYRSRVKGYMLRHKVKPGITGWAQIHGWRGTTEDIHEMEMRIKHDLWYIRNWNMWLDLKIIARTVVCGFSGKNAY